jgi:hypothetical protein
MTAAREILSNVAMAHNASSLPTTNLDFDATNRDVRTP